MKTFAAILAGLALLAALTGCGLFDSNDITIGPGQAAVHTPITIYGDFGWIHGTVTIGGRPATILSWEDDSILALVPVIATPGGQSVEASVVVSSEDGEWTDTLTVVRGILFQTDREGDWEIYVMNPDGTNPRNVSMNTAGDVEPDWSPDGTKIALTRWVGDDRSIYVMDADGTNVKRLTSGPNWDEAPDWSPDGAWIAFQSLRDGKQQLFAVRADGAEIVKLSRSAYIEAYPAWSPDGSLIAFTSPRDGTNEDIYLMEADGTVTRLTSLTGTDTAAAWSPDGTKIAFASAATGVPDVLTYDFDADEVTNVPLIPLGQQGNPSANRFSSLREDAYNSRAWIGDVSGSGCFSALVLDHSRCWPASLFIFQNTRHGLSLNRPGFSGGSVT